MPIRFQIPFSLNLEDNQIDRIERDIDKKIQKINNNYYDKTVYELDTYSIEVVVTLRERSK